MKSSLIVVDIETTGISPEYHRITEIGAIKVVEDEIVGTYSQLINPEAIVTEEITRITGLTNAILESQPTLGEVYSEFYTFCEDLPLLGHNIMFDFSFLKYHGNQLGYRFERSGVDTYPLAHRYLPELKSKSLTSIIAYMGIEREIAHRAFHDAKATYEVFAKFKSEYATTDDGSLFLPKPLHWRAKKQSPITDKQKNFLSSLIRQHHIFTEVDVAGLTKSEASRYIDRILFLKGR